jgi:hypothetical protein
MFGRSLSAGALSWRWSEFSGGGSHGNVAAVTLEAAEKSELARWGHGEGELPEALAAPIWGRYALFRGHPRITAMVMWDVRERQVLVAGERGSERFEDALIPGSLSRVSVTLPSSSTLRDTSPEYSVTAEQDGPSAGAGEPAGSR